MERIPRKATNKLSQMEFKHRLLTILGKFNETHLQEAASIEIERLLTDSINDSEKLNLIIISLSERKSNISDFTKKEILKVYVKFSKILKEKTIPYFSKIFNDLIHNLKENKKKLFPVISGVIGKFCENLFLFATDSQSINLIELAFDKLFADFQKENKDVQSALAQSLSKIIQATPIEILIDISEKVINNLFEHFLHKKTKAKTEILECLLCYVLAIEENFKISNPEVLQSILILAMKNKEGKCRKAAANFIYTLNIIKPFALEDFKSEIVKGLKTIRYDNDCSVREAARIALQSFNEIPNSGIKSRFNTEDFNESEGTPRNLNVNFRKIFDSKLKENSKYSMRDFNSALSNKKSVPSLVIKMATEGDEEMSRGLHMDSVNSFNFQRNEDKNSCNKCEVAIAIMKGCILLEEKMRKMELEYRTEIDLLKEEIFKINSYFPQRRKTEVSPLKSFHSNMVEKNIEKNETYYQKKSVHEENRRQPRPSYSCDRFNKENDLEFISPVIKELLSKRLN